MGHGRLGLPPELPPCGQLDAKDPCCLQYDVMRTPPKHTDMLAEADYRAVQKRTQPVLLIEEAAVMWQAGSNPRVTSAGQDQSRLQAGEKSSLVFMSHWVMGLHRLSGCRTAWSSALVFSVFSS